MSEAKYIKKIDSRHEGVRIQQGVESEQVTFGRKHSRREKALFAALSIVLIVAIVFTLLYCLQVSKKGTTDKQGEQRTPSTKTRPNCLLPGCIFSASGQFI